MTSILSARKSAKQAAFAGVGLAAGLAGTLLAAGPASAASVSSSFITSQPHSVQRACAERILAAQGSGAWTAWNGSLDDMSLESGNNDKAVNASSGAAGYYQIMPSTWADLCSDLGGSASAASVPTTAPAAAVQKATATSGKTSGASQAAGGVAAVQQLLVDQGYSVGAEGVDGILGPHTAAGVMAFQADHGLAVDGVPGPITWAALNS